MYKSNFAHGEISKDEADLDTQRKKIKRERLLRNKKADRRYQRDTPPLHEPEKPLPLEVPDHHPDQISEGQDEEDLNTQHEKQDEADLDRQHGELRQRLLTGTMQANDAYQRDITAPLNEPETSLSSPSEIEAVSAQTPDTIQPSEAQDAIPTESDAPKNTPHDPTYYPPHWKLEPLEKRPPHNPSQKSTPWELEPMENSKPLSAIPPLSALPIAALPPLPDSTHPSQNNTNTRGVTVENTAPLGSSAPESLQVSEETLMEHRTVREPQALARDVVEKFLNNFSLDKQTLKETPGFTTLNKPQQRLVLERFASLVREEIHTKAVKEHLGKSTEIKQSPAVTRFGKLKRAVRTSFHTATRSLQIGKQEGKLHADWRTGARHEEEKLRLLASLTKGVQEENSFGIDRNGHTDFTGGNPSLAFINKKLNALIEKKPDIGEAAAQERLLAINEAIAEGITAFRTTHPAVFYTIPENNERFEKFATEWALRARREITIGTFMGRHRSLAKNLEVNEATRGFVRMTLLERGGIAATGFAARGVLGALCGFLAAPLVGAGIGGFMGWRRKGLEQSDADLLARMGEKIPKHPRDIYTLHHLTSLQKGAQKRLDAALKKNNTVLIDTLRERVEKYEKEISLLSSTSARREASSSTFVFDTGKSLAQKLTTLTTAYEHAHKELVELVRDNAPESDQKAARKRIAEVEGRLNARLDYTQKRLLQRRVQLDTVNGSASARAQTMTDIMLALGTAETKLALHNPKKNAEVRAHLAQVSAMLAGRDKKISNERLSEMKRALLEGAAIGAGFGFAGAALADVFSSTSTLKEGLSKIPIPTELADHVFPEKEVLTPYSNGMNTAHVENPLQSAGKALPPENEGTWGTSSPQNQTPQTPSTPTQSTVTETVVGGFGGKQSMINDTHSPSAAVGVNHEGMAEEDAEPSVDASHKNEVLRSYDDTLRIHSGREYLSKNAESLIRENGGTPHDLARAQMHSQNIAIKMNAYDKLIAAGRTAEARDILAEVQRNVSKLNERFGEVFDETQIPTL